MKELPQVFTCDYLSLSCVTREKQTHDLALGEQGRLHGFPDYTTTSASLIRFALL